MPGILDPLRDQLRENVSLTARRVAREWERELLRTSPQETGNMKDHTEVVARTTPTGATIEARVDTDYAEYVAKGTRPHVIEPRKLGGVLVFKIGNQTIFAARVNHPGARPDDWWDRALQNVPSMIQRSWH